MVLVVVGSRRILNVFYWYSCIDKIVIFYLKMYVMVICLYVWFEVVCVLFVICLLFVCGWLDVVWIEWVICLEKFLVVWIIVVKYLKNICICVNSGGYLFGRNF